MNSKEFGAAVGLGVRRIEQLVEQKVIHARRIPDGPKGKIRNEIPPSEVDRFLAERGQPLSTRRNTRTEITQPILDTCAVPAIQDLLQDSTLLDRLYVESHPNNSAYDAAMQSLTHCRETASIRLNVVKAAEAEGRVVLTQRVDAWIDRVGEVFQAAIDAKRIGPEEEIHRILDSLGNP